MPLKPNRAADAAGCSNEADMIGMRADMGGDIFIRTDVEGFIQETSSGLDAVGIDLPRTLLKPHVADLAAKRHMGNLRDYHRHALQGTAPLDKIIFPAALTPRQQLAASMAANDHAEHGAEDWYSLSLNPAPETGLLGVMRRIENGLGLRPQMAVTALTDPLTGMPNRKAFSAALGKALAMPETGTVAFFEVDHFRAITLRFGPSMGDEVVKAFAQFLTAISGRGIAIAHMEGERFAALLPQHNLVDALAWAQEVIETFAAISADLGFENTQLTASAGVAQLHGSTDSIMSRAELGVSVAKASGGKRTECGDWLHGCENAETIYDRRGLVAAR
ncbi:MAG: GGDEF domain-containing protein [Marinomonas sp.]